MKKDKPLTAPQKQQKGYAAVWKRWCCLRGVPAWLRGLVCHYLEGQGGLNVVSRLIMGLTWVIRWLMGGVLSYLLRSPDTPSSGYFRHVQVGALPTFQARFFFRRFYACKGLSYLGCFPTRFQYVVTRLLVPLHGSVLLLAWDLIDGSLLAMWVWWRVVGVRGICIDDMRFSQESPLCWCRWLAGSSEIRTSAWAAV